MGSEVPMTADFGNTYYKELISKEEKMSDPNLPEGVTQDDIDMYDEPSPLTTGEEESKELISKEEILLTKILADTEKMKNRIRWLDENSPMTKLIVGT